MSSRASVALAFAMSVFLTSAGIASPTMLPIVGQLAKLGNPCPNATPGTVCPGGAIFLGTLSPGATSGSGTDKYMIAPSGCADIPAGSVSGGSGISSYALADFSPASCSGTDALTKSWNDGSTNYYDIPGLTNWQYAGGTSGGPTNTDDKYGADNQAVLVAITAGAQGGYHAAARYCDKLVVAGFSDWYLPNMYELNLIYTNRASIPGLNTSGTYYWSSTEYSSSGSWLQRMTDGNQGLFNKNNGVLVRCVRRYK